MFKRKLNSVELKYSNYTIDGLLFFDKCIDQIKFRIALFNALDYFPILYGKFSKEEDGVYIKSNNKEDFIFKIEFIPEDITHTDVELNRISLERIPLPREINNGRNLSIFSIGALKLNVFNNGFSIEYAINHVFGDFSSVFTFIKIVSDIYSDRHIDKVTFYDYSDLLEAPLKFDNINEFRTFGLSVRRVFAPSIQTTKATNLSKYLWLKISFSKKNLDYKRINKEISRNDIMQSTLFKIFGLSLQDTARATLTFVCDMRSRLQIPPSIIGNIFSYYGFSYENKFLKKINIMELSKKSRNVVDSISPENYKKFLSWYASIETFNENPLLFCAANYVCPECFLISNVSSLNFSTIDFRGTSPHAFQKSITNDIIHDRFCSILFERKKGECYFYTIMGIPDYTLGAVEDLAKQENLFKIELLPSQSHHH